MARTRVLIVDDSVVVRRLMTDALSHDPTLEIAGSASSGRTGLMKIPLLRPDVVVLDIDMPEMDGVDTLAAIRKNHPDLPVVMLTVPSHHGRALLRALSLGASGYVMKPATVAEADGALHMRVGELAAKIGACCREALMTSKAQPVTAHGAAGPAEGDGLPRVDVLAIGVSTGGPDALMDLIPRFPKDFPVPIVIVLHSPPTFTRILAERLSEKSHLRVVEGSTNQDIVAGGAWIAPGGFHMGVRRDGVSRRIMLHQDPPEHSCRPAVDVLFRSVALCYGRHALALVMTGMGRDGLGGCEHVHAAGGRVLVQDQTSSVVWGMPGLVARAGIADKILPLAALAPEILMRAWAHRDRPQRAWTADTRAVMNGKA